MCFGSFQFNWGLLEKSETLSLENRNTYEMGSSSERDGNSALFRNLWSWVYSWGFLTQFQNSILLFHNNRKHLQKKKQIVSPHITFYEFTLISAYRSYILSVTYPLTNSVSPILVSESSERCRVVSGLRAVRQSLLYMIDIKI